jgi:AbrB family looped-hinge helix DNA binding protein
MKETIYVFKVDSQNRISLPLMAREIYGFKKEVYFKLQVIDGQKYLQISGTAIEFYHTMSKLDTKGRVIIPKEAREKLDICCGDTFDTYEDEIDSKERSLLLRKVLKK